MTQKATEQAQADDNNEFEKLRTNEQLYRKIVSASPDGVMVLQDLRIVDCNRKLEVMLGAPREQLLGKSPWELGSENDAHARGSEQRGREYGRRAIDGETLKFEWEYFSGKGHRRVFEVNLYCFRLEDGPRIYCRVNEVTEAVESRRRLERRNEFEKLLFETSNRLLAANSTSLTDEINASIARVCNFYNVDRGSVWWLDRKRQIGIGNNVHGYGDQAGSFVIRDFSNLPWTIEALFSGKHDRITVPEDLPDNAIEDLAFLREVGVKTAMLIPVAGGGDEIGVAGVSMISEHRKWAPSDQFELSLIMQIIGAAWARGVHRHTSEEGARDLRRSQRVARVGSYQIVAFGVQPLSWETGKLLQSDQARRIRPSRPELSAYESILDRVHEADLPMLRDALSDFESLADRSPLLYRRLGVDGEIVHVEERFELDLGSNGEVERVFGTIRDVTELVRTTDDLRRALDEIKALKDMLQAENVVLRDEVRAARLTSSIVGSSNALRRTLTSVEQVAPTDVTVLILGETGTGKELIARALHAASERQSGPMVCVNCAAMSTELIESELFGHEKGAFTDAVSARKGRFELADGGTLLLDEIGELPQEVQAKLLRVLQSGEFERLGGSKTIRVNTRVIAATNRNIEGMVEQGEFRSDLYYRINHFPITVPPLRDRREDIPALVAHFLEKYQESSQSPVRAVSQRLLDKLTEMPWPGNIRELEGFVHRTMLTATGPVLDITDQARIGQEARPFEPQSPPEIIGTTVRTDTFEPGTAEGDLSLESMQRRHIREALQHCDWMIDGPRGAAALLDLPPSSLRSKMKRLGIERPH